MAWGLLSVPQPCERRQTEQDVREQHSPLQLGLKFSHLSTHSPHAPLSMLSSCVTFLFLQETKTPLCIWQTGSQASVCCLQTDFCPGSYAQPSHALPVKQSQSWDHNSLLQLSEWGMATFWGIPASACWWSHHPRVPHCSWARNSVSPGQSKLQHLTINLH